MNTGVLMPATLTNAANNFRSWQGTDKSAKFVEWMAANAPIDYDYPPDNIRLVICEMQRKDLRISGVRSIGLILSGP